MQAIDRTEESMYRIIREISFQNSLLSLSSALEAAGTGAPPDASSSLAALRGSLTVMPPGEAHAEIPR